VPTHEGRCRRNVYCGGRRALHPRCQGKKLGRIVHGQPATTNLGFAATTEDVVFTSASTSARQPQIAGIPVPVQRRRDRSRMERRPSNRLLPISASIVPKSGRPDFGAGAQSGAAAPSASLSRITCRKTGIHAGYLNCIGGNLMTFISTFLAGKCWRCPPPQAALRRPASAARGRSSPSSASTSSIQHWKDISTAEPINSIADGMGGPLGPVEGPVCGKKAVSSVSDIHASKRMKYTPGQASPYSEKTNQANGLTRDLQGRLLACEHETRRVIRQELDGSITVIANSFQGRRLNRAE